MRALRSRRATMSVVWALAVMLGVPASHAEAAQRPAWAVREGALLTNFTAPSVAVSPGGEVVYVIGAVRHRGGASTLLVRARASATGDRLWSARYRGRQGLFHDAGWVTVGEAGTLYVLVEFRRDGGGRGVMVLSFDGSDGTRRWTRTVGGAADADAGGIALSPEGSRLYVAVTSGPAPEHVAVTALDASDGSPSWTGRYLGPDDRPDVMEGSIAVTADAVVVAVHGRYDFERTSFGWATTVAFDAATGDVMWDGVSGRGGWPAQYSEHALALSPDGGTVTTGGWSRSRPAAVAFDVATGARLWHRVFRGHGPGSLQSAAVSPDGTQVLLAGDAGRSRLVVVALDAATGAASWWNEMRDWKGYPWIGDAELAPDGSALYVPIPICGPAAAVEGFGCYLDYGLLRYRAATGRRALLGRYASPVGGSEWPADLAIAPAGLRVFVTGRSDVEGRFQRFPQALATVMFRESFPDRGARLPDGLSLIG